MKSKSQAIELTIGGHGLPTGAVQLPLLDHVHGLNSRYQLVRAPKRLESEHRVCHSFHSPVGLFGDVIEVFRLA